MHGNVLQDNYLHLRFQPSGPQLDRDRVNPRRLWIVKRRKSNQLPAQFHDGSINTIHRPASAGSDDPSRWVRRSLTFRSHVQTHRRRAMLDHKK